MVPYTITGPAMMNILAAIPVTRPSLLNSRAAEVTAFEKPVIGTNVPAPANFAMLSYSFSPVKIAAAKISVIDVIVPALSSGRPSFPYRLSDTAYKTACHKCLYGI